MKILLFGKNGQLGWELQRSLTPLGNIIALDRSGSNNLVGDITNLDGLIKTIKTISPDVIVNAAAYTQVDKAETDIELNELVNATAPGIIAREAAKIGALLVHYSTDYVFDGTGNQPWKETDKTNPLNVYGKSKLQSELNIQKSGCKHLIFRTSWVYGRWGKNFIKTIFKLANEREQLSIIDDQIGAPTGAELLADVTAHAILQAINNPITFNGIYNVAPHGETSWYDYARFIVETSNKLGIMDKKRIIGLKTKDYPTAAKRPSNSRLNIEKLTKTFSMHLPEWQVGVERMIKEYME